MIKKNISLAISLIIIFIFGTSIISLPHDSEAFEWWKPFKYEKWNCCNNSNFQPLSIQDSSSRNDIIQNLEINQICENVEICYIDLGHLNNQRSYSNLK
jgi:hypothetical protein